MRNYGIFSIFFFFFLVLLRLFRRSPIDMFDGLLFVLPLLFFSFWVLNFTSCDDSYSKKRNILDDCNSNSRDCNRICRGDFVSIIFLNSSPRIMSYSYVVFSIFLCAEVVGSCFSSFFIIEKELKR